MIDALPFFPDNPLSLESLFSALRSFKSIEKLILCFRNYEIDDLQPLNGLPIRSLVVYCGRISVGLAPFIRTNTDIEFLEFEMAKMAEVSSFESELVEALSVNKTLRSLKLLEHLSLSRELFDVFGPNLSLNTLQITCSSGSSVGNFQ